MSSTRRRLAAATTGAVLLAASGVTAYAASGHATSGNGAPAPGARSLAGLRVLISNDDSMQAAKKSNSDGMGLYELRRAMCAAGADVVVIAPWQVQSGKGTAVTNGGVLTAQRRTALPAGYENDCAGAPAQGAVFGVCLSEGPCGGDSPSATPADTVKLALRGGLKAKTGWDRAPDLVLSGINSGPNVSAQVNDSGTVGAAIAAIDEGVPAIAFSSAGDETNSYFPQENYRAHAAFGARFVAGLRERGLLTPEFALKVDYPDISTGTPAGPPRWTSVGHGKVVWHAYEQVGADSFAIGLGFCGDRPGDPCSETVADADSAALFRDGRISVTPLTSDRTYGAKTPDPRTLRKIHRYVENDAPRR
ncbi:5'/3'-nucleotidase SurE [Streptomyces sp. ZAF1911]|uniref:5'/3'-nucleotidase SurE n=1 Tax=Streptomyces sp. ZAF1911 TaxID=2944129 RepID=UPI00237BA8E3|nr:5'/3'-nucleotidase SurE [Streptomyces sp. ZAF1911]MDD9376302.1 5'/3'-nucleotidase SurE [Streptomyces sp. ZAF1911]